MKLLHFCIGLFAASSLFAGPVAFPPRGTEKAVRGELVSADFVHRRGEFRAESGELTGFSMPPFAILKHRGAEADLREVPLGTKMTFLMLPDENGRLSQLVTTQDDQPADEAQRKKFIDFTKTRGLAGWIEQTDVSKITVTFFSGDPQRFEATWMADFAVGKSVKVCVANDELRTWNPPVDGMSGSVVEVQPTSSEGFGNSGVRLVISMSLNNMLEGFRKGRVVRIFGAGWKVMDQFYGESLMGYGFGRMLNQELVENPPKEYPDQFPFRTDYGNAHLPWYALQPGVKPPPFSEHLVFGELVQADTTARTGQFRTDRTGEVVSFTLHEPAVLKHLGNDAKLDALPTGQRYRFHLFQDEQGRFTRVAAISDDFSHQAANHITYRILSAQPDALHLAWQLPEVKDYNGDMQRPPDIGHSILRVAPDTRVWKDKSPLPLSELKPKDVLRFNQTAELPGKPARGADLWITTESAAAK